MGHGLSVGLENLANNPRSLSYHDRYCCPVCASGELAALTLTEAFACSFCRHIFTANLQAQSIQVVDSPQPMVWYWTGDRWCSANRSNTRITLLVWCVALVLACLPALLIALAGYLFPPLSPGAGLSFSTRWAGLALVTHAGMVVWLIAEHHQWPWYVSLKVRLRR